MHLDADQFIHDERQLELIDLAETQPVMAVNTAIREALVGDLALSGEVRKAAMADRTLVITNARHRELIELAAGGYPASAVRFAAVEAVKGARSGTPIEAAMSEGLKQQLRGERFTNFVLQQLPLPFGA